MYIFDTVVYIILFMPKKHTYIYIQKKTECKWIIIMYNVKILARIFNLIMWIAELKLNIMYIYCLGLAWLITKKPQNHEIGK